MRLFVVLTLQGDIQHDISVTLLCQDRHHKNMPSDLLDIQWWTGEHLVVWFQLGRIIQGSRYISRTHLSAEGLRNVDFSLSITCTEYSDSGWYWCVLTKDGHEVALGEVDFEVIGKPLCHNAFLKVYFYINFSHLHFLSLFSPQISKCVVCGVRTEGRFVLFRLCWLVRRTGCICSVEKMDSGGEDPVFEGRVSVPKERIATFLLFLMARSQEMRAMCASLRKIMTSDPLQLLILLSQAGWMSTFEVLREPFISLKTFI